MKIDFATLAFGYSVKKGGGTPNWATSLGQGKEYKINENPDVDELLRGIVYSSVPLNRVSTKIGKGGKLVSGNAIDSPVIIASVFNKVYINDSRIEHGQYIILITRDTSESHAGRLRFKYGPSNTYINGEQKYSNEQFWGQAKNQLGLNATACFFVYDISVRNQDELILRTVVVDKNESREYEDSVDHHNQWEGLIKDDENTFSRLEDINDNTSSNSISISDFSPAWFKEKSLEFPSLDDDVSHYLHKKYDFSRIFSTLMLSALRERKVLDCIFLNDKNKTNLCYVLESDSFCNEYFGKIKSGDPFEYGLFYDETNQSWVTGSSSAPVFISEEKAIELGKQIRDFLVRGGEVILFPEEHGMDGIKTSEDYYAILYEKLCKATNGYINREWVLKYFAMIFPDIFPFFYSFSSQMNVINKLGLETKDNAISRLGEISKFVKKCNISNVMFRKIFETYCNVDSTMTEKKNAPKNCLDVQRIARPKGGFPLNVIIYGAPGTGKTYSTAEYALAIIEHRPVNLSYKTPEERKEVMRSYNEYVRVGQIVFTTFHQNYGYEEFIQGLRPNDNPGEISFKTVDGVFKKIADTALNDINQNYVLIIDEINRANISKVFGELITLIEEDKRWGEVNQTCVTLQSGDVFAVPNNLYIIGTMNSADKSILLIDVALRRRFDFIEQYTDGSLIRNEILRKVFTRINDKLADDFDSTDLLIGHSYFMDKSESDLSQILNNSVIPLLYEYYYDDKKKVKSILNVALKDLEFEIIDERIRRIYVKKKDSPQA